MPQEDEDEEDETASANIDYIMPYRLTAQGSLDREVMDLGV